MDIYGYPWLPTDNHGHPWISMDIRGYPWGLVVFFGSVPLRSQIVGCDLWFGVALGHVSRSIECLIRGPAGRRAPRPIHDKHDFRLVILMIVVPRESSDTVHCYRPFCAP